jgi:hypothetical protein
MIAMPALIAACAPPKAAVETERTKTCAQGRVIERAGVHFLPGVPAEEPVDRTVGAVFGNEHVIDDDVMAAGALQAEHLPSILVDRIVATRQQEGAHLRRSAIVPGRTERAQQNPAAMADPVEKPQRPTGGSRLRHG